MTGYKPRRALTELSLIFTPPTFFDLLITPSASPYALDQGNTVKTAPNDIGRGLDWPPSNQKSLERGLMTRYLTVLSASYETYSNEPYNNSYLMNMLFVNRCGDIRKEYHTERPTETPLARPHSLKGCVTTTLICLRYG